MENRNLDSLEMAEDQSHTPGKVMSVEPLPISVQRIQKKMGCIKTCNSLIVFMLFIALAGFTFTIYSLYHLQHQVTQMNLINGSTQNTPQKLTGKESNDRSERLMWESRLGSAFINGVKYKHGALVINKTGQYFIYSKVHFRGNECQSTPLHQTILKRGNYKIDLSLMRVRELNYCNGSGYWGKSTFQAGIFHLNEGVEVYVSVSHPTMVSSDELLTFFGLYKV